MSDANFVGSVFVNDIREALFRWHKASIAMAIVTLVNYEGKSPRPIGSQLLVTEQGDSVGLISGGCLESAIIDEAQRSIKSGQPQLIRYGKDSDYMDIRLPCGSGIDVFILPNPSSRWLSSLYQALIERREIDWSVALTSGQVTLCETVVWRDIEANRAQSATANQQLTRKQVQQSLSSFSKTFIPKIRLVVYGSGAVFEHFCMQAKAFDFELIAIGYSDSDYVDSDYADLDLVNPATVDVELRSVLDRFSAFVCLSHEHDNEARVIAKALSTPAFYISALGSTESHRKRVAELSALNVSAEDIARVKGPAGLDLNCRTPAEIALSILAELIAQKNLCCWA